MNHLLKNTLSTILAASLFFSAFTAYADEALQTVPVSEKTELRAESISFEFISTKYNGKAQKPKITVSSGEKVLTENEDFIVNYPEDCVNAGLKTVSVSGSGGYSGSFSGTYLIEPLDVSGTDVEFIAVADPCTYNGYAQTPSFQITANGMNISEADYTKKYLNNINASQKAVCEFTFTGNFTGSRRAEFTVSKAEYGDLDIEIPIDMAAAGGTYDFSYDLSKLLPKGAYCGAPIYSPWFFPNDKPTVAFNELHCTVCEEASKAAVGIPVFGAENYQNFYINFFFKDSQKIKPELVIKPINREYNGKPVTEDELAKAGCYAVSDGKIIKGQWIIWKKLTAEPHSAIPVVCTFEPDDPAYESIYGIVYVTVNKISLPEFSVELSSTRTALGGKVYLTVNGVPEDRLDLLRIECSPRSEDFSFEEYPDKTSLRFRLMMPYENEIFTVTVSLPEDGHHTAASSSAEIIVGNYIPPEEQITDKVTTAEELAELIAAAPFNGFVTALGIRSLSAANLSAASQKRLTVEVKLNDTYTWVLQTWNFSANASLNLELGTAAIPSVLTGKIGGTAVNSFTVNEKNFLDGTELRVTLKNPQKDKFANLFYYSSNGELEFCSCARIESDNTVKLPVGKSGKYVVITDIETKLFGDINDDCKFNFNDLIDFVYIYANGLSTPDKLYKQDINGDGLLSFDDLVKLVTIYANST